MVTVPPPPSGEPSLPVAHTAPPPPAAWQRVDAPTAGWTPPPTPAPRSSIGMRIVGIALLLPALAVLVVQHVLPTISTIALSQQSVQLTGGDPEPAPGQLASGVGQFFEVLGTSLLLGVPTTVLAGLLGLAIAQSARLGWTSRTTQVLLGIVGVVYAPLGALGAALLLFGIGGFGPHLALLAATLPIGTAIVATALSAAMRSDRRVLGALLVLAIGLLASGGLAPQVFDVPYALGMRSVPVAIYEQAFLTLDVGFAAAVTMPLIVWTGLLGLLIVGIVAGARLRLVPEQRARPSVGLGIIGLLGALVLVAITIGIVAVIALQPGGPGQQVDLLGATARTWGGSALLALAGVLVGGLAAFGIGWCRPLGRHSAWLLVLWAPALLAGPATTMVARLVELSDADLLDSPIAAASAVLVAPVVVVLTPLLLGLREQLRWTSAATTSTIGLALLLLVTITVVDAQSMLPQLVFVTSTDGTLPLVGLASVITFSGMGLAVVLSPVLVALAVLGVGAQLLLSRVRLAVGAHG